MHAKYCFEVSILGGNIKVLASFLYTYIVAFIPILFWCVARFDSQLKPQWFS